MENEFTVFIQVTDLDDVRTTLGAVAQYLQAEDIAQAQRRMKSNVEYSQLTKEVMRITSRVEAVLKDHLLDQHDDEPVPVPDYPEPDPED